MFNTKHNRKDVQLVAHCFFSKSTGKVEYKNYTEYYKTEGHE